MLQLIDFSLKFVWTVDNEMHMQAVGEHILGVFAEKWTTEMI